MARVALYPEPNKANDKRYNAAGQMHLTSAMSGCLSPAAWAAI